MKQKIKSIFEMRHFLRKAGKIPGDLESSQVEFESSKIELIRYDKDFYDQQTMDEAGQLTESIIKNTHNWISILGLNDPETLQHLGSIYSIHSLTLEDVINTDHLPKCEPSEEHLFFTLKFPTYNEKKDFLELKHISLILANHYLITLQEGHDDYLVRIKDRLKNAQGKIRFRNLEYLFYSLIDFIVDQYFYIMDVIRDKIEETEDLLIDEPSTDHIQNIHSIKKRIVYLRRYITSLNKAVYMLQSEEIQFKDKHVKIYIRDVYDHTTHINESLTTLKELQTTLLEMNMANASNSMNRVMKTLTIVATLFIPLTFIAGIYGMNFHNMPELQWEYGYPAIILLMLLIASIMVIFMKRKNWF